MHKIHFRPGLRPGHRWGAYEFTASRSQDIQNGGGGPAIMFSRAPLWLSTGLMFSLFLLFSVTLVFKKLVNLRSANLH